MRIIEPMIKTSSQNGIDKSNANKLTKKKNVGSNIGILLTNSTTNPAIIGNISPVIIPFLVLFSDDMLQMWKFEKSYIT